MHVLRDLKYCSSADYDTIGDTDGEESLIVCEITYGACGLNDCTHILQPDSSNCKWYQLQDEIMNLP